MTFMQKAAKEKTFSLLLVIATALLSCAPAIASSERVLGPNNRAEKIYLGSLDRIEQTALGPANHVEFGTELRTIVLESLVAPNRTVTGGITRIPNDRVPFADLDHTSVPLRQLSSDRIKITNRGIDLVDEHLSRFVDNAGQPFANNTVMLRDLRNIASGKMKPTQIHRDFYAHELREMVRYRNAGVAAGEQLPLGRHLNAHYGTLREYRIPFEGHGDYLYTPEALDALTRQLLWQ